MLRFVSLGLLLVLATLALFPEASASSPAVLEVDREDDDPTATACTPAPNDCSARGAIINANSNPDFSDVYVPGGTYTITVNGGNEDLGMTGDFDILEDMRLRGDGAGVTNFEGGIDRIIDIHAGEDFEIDVQISGVTLLGGSPPSGGGGALRNNFGKLLLTDSVLTKNSAAYGAGMELVNSRTTILRSQVVASAANSAQSAGGIYNNTGVLNIADSTIAYNSGSGAGGLTNAGGDVTITNSTISNNTATNGAGGINSNNDLLIINSTITANTSDIADGTGGVLATREAPETVLKNTIVSGNLVGGGGAHPDCLGSMTSAGYNLIGMVTPSAIAGGPPPAGCDITGETSTDITGQGAMLGALMDNGGPTQTHALNAGSPAINAIPASNCPPPLLDQRGLKRPAGGACDIGAFESDALAPAPQMELWGDNLCDGAVDGGDILPPLQFYADLAVTPGADDCPSLSDAIYPDGEPYSWGDTDCSGEISLLDALLILLWLADTPEEVLFCLEIGAAYNIFG